MAETAAAASHSEVAQLEVRLPPGPRIPKVVQGVLFALSRRRVMHWLARRYGTAFTMNSPVFGPTVVVSHPDLARQVFLTSPDELGNVKPNLSRVLGPGSVFALEGSAHRRRRNLIGPLFHGKRIRAYEQVVVEETLKEAASWPAGEEFATLQPMMRITLNVILRAVFGAAGADLDDLRRITPPWVTLGSRLVTMPIPIRTFGRFTPWGRLAEWRRQYEAVLDRLIAEARSDPHFDERTDVLSVMLRSEYEDGAVMSRREIADELLTLLAAGHETTASTLAWVFERLSRQPELLTALAAEADTDGATLRRAAIREVQRTRTVIDFAGRHVYAPRFELGEWVIPQGYSIVVAIGLIHQSADAFEDPDRFDVQRYLDQNPSTFAWVPYGGGTRRCPGSSFANLEMDIVLRTVLRNFTIEPTTAPGETWHARGVAFTPKKGGRIVVQRRG
ncbi:MAG TPA: cytochrome P450 [Mycobacterium sp.]|nr:cytochrome P450 [Mycobacterium sp.]